MQSMTDSELRDSTTADEIAEGEIIDLEIVDADDGFERPDSIYHFILLAVCAAVLVLSMLLTVRGEGGGRSPIYQCRIARNMLIQASCWTGLPWVWIDKMFCQPWPRGCAASVSL